VLWMGRRARENAGRMFDASFSFVSAILTVYARVDANSIRRASLITLGPRRAKRCAAKGTMSSS